MAFRHRFPSREPMKNRRASESVRINGSICAELGIAESFLKLYAALVDANHSKVR